MDDSKDTEDDDRIIRWILNITCVRYETWLRSESASEKAEAELESINKDIDAIEYLLVDRDPQRLSAEEQCKLDSLKAKVQDAEEDYFNWATEATMDSFKCDRANYVFEFYMEMESTGKLRYRQQQLEYWLQELLNDGKNEAKELTWDFSPTPLECGLYVSTTDSTTEYLLESNQPEVIAIGKKLEMHTGSNVMKMDYAAFKICTVNDIEVKYKNNSWNFLSTKIGSVYDRGKYF